MAFAAAIAASASSTSITEITVRVVHQPCAPRLSGVKRSAFTRAELLFLPQRRPGLHARKQMRAHARAVPRAIADEHLRAPRACLADHADEPLRRARAEQRAERRQVGREERGERGAQGGCDRAHGDHALGRHADLARVCERAEDDGARGVVDVCALEDLGRVRSDGVRWSAGMVEGKAAYDGGRFAAELEHAGLEVLGGLGGERAPDAVAARELVSGRAVRWC